MRVGIARELDAVAHAPVGAETVDVVGQRVEAGAFGGVGRLVVVPAAVERGIAVLVDERREHAAPAPRIGSGTTPPAIPLCTGPSSARTRTSTLASPRNE